MKHIMISVFAILLLGAGCVAGEREGSAGTASGMEESRTTLDLSGQELTEVPSGTFKRTHLEELNIADNQLTGELSAEIRKLKRLRMFDVSDNQLTGVPAEIGQLEQLEILDLSFNALTTLPHEIGNLQNLKRLELIGNDISETDLQAIREALPEATQISI